MLLIPIGHPGKSKEISLSPYNQDYGKWEKEVTEQLGYCIIYQKVILDIYKIR